MAFGDIGDVHVRAVQSDRGHDLIQQLTRLADERLPFPILVKPRPFPDEHHLRVRITDADHKFYPRIAERTKMTIPDRLHTQLFKLLQIRRRCRHPGARLARISSQNARNRFPPIHRFPIILPKMVPKILNERR
jgi:hypothetical protein